MAMRSGCNPSLVNNTCNIDELNLTRQAYALAHLFLEQDEASMAGGVLMSLEQSGTRAMFATVHDKIDREFGRGTAERALKRYRNDTAGVRSQ